MRRRPRLMLMMMMMVTTPGWAGAETERVVLPLSVWDSVQAALQPPPPNTPTAAWSSLGRSIQGTLEGGLLEATLDARFEVFATDGWLDVPVLDASASLVSVRVNGAPAALRKADAFHAVGIAKPGVYRVQVRFLHGRTADRFSGALSLALPDAGPAHLDVTVPETGFEATLKGGVLTRVETVGQRTRLRGETNGGIQLTWARAERAPTEATRLTATQTTLFTVQPALLSGRTVLDYIVESGETDRLALRVPAGLEVLNVLGDDVLQWRAAPPAADADAGELTVLLSRLIDDTVRIEIECQQAVVAEMVRLRPPMPVPSVPTVGRFGVESAAGLDLDVVTVQGASGLAHNALPAALTEMTTHPVLFGFQHRAPAEVRLGLTRNAALPLTGTIIDELEASTLLLEDGTEVVKVRLHLRNNTRQYLGLTLPEGARLTHALIDGHPVHPATEGDARQLLVPLRQSMRAGGERYHLVQHGETLGAIAYIYYSNPQKWPLILDANDDLYDPDDATPGTRLRIPAQPGVEVEESRFLLEFAWRRVRPALGDWGQQRLVLPELDVDVVKATWHVYLPKAVTPVRFDGNFAQYSAVRYDLFRRFGMFIRTALLGGEAWAGGRGHILKKRRGLYLADAARDGRVALGAFPLVGEKYRFKRLLLGEETPAITVSYLSAGSVSAVRWGALGLALLIGILVLRPRSGLPSGLLGLLLFAPLLVLGHHVGGVHRHLVWGLDLALIALLLRYRAEPMARTLAGWIRTPTRLVELLSVRHALIALGLLALLRAVTAFPLFLSLGALVALTLAWIRARQSPELRHA